MNNLSRTTLNFAKARNLYLDFDLCEDHSLPFIWVGVDDDCTEPMFSLFANADGSFSYRGNIWLNKSTKEEIPAHISDEKQLRKIIAFISIDMKEEIAACFH